MILTVPSFNTCLSFNSHKNPQILFKQLILSFLGRLLFVKLVAILFEILPAFPFS